MGPEEIGAAGNAAQLDIAMAGKRRRSSKERYHLLDVIRGITLISMICYHGSWDLVYIFGVGGGFARWYQSQSAFYWQQSICWTFILLSGFCIPLSVHRIRRGVIVSLAGALVTAVTLVFMPEDRVIFGVLTFIGSAMLLCGLLYRWLSRIPGIIGFILNAYLFYLFRNVNSGFLTLYPGRRILVWHRLYQGWLPTYLGFMDPGFYSTDYFSLLPWIFLFLAGMYLHLAISKEGGFRWRIMYCNIPPLSFLGQHSLLIYLLHQPALYLVFSLLQMAGVL